MSALKIPPGDDRVAFGEKSKKQKEKEAFASHIPGKHIEADYAAIEKTASRKQTLKPQPRKLEGGSDAKVR